MILPFIVNFIPFIVFITLKIDAYEHFDELYVGKLIITLINNDTT